MNTRLKFFCLTTFLAFFTAPLALHAQDVPPPPDDQGQQFQGQEQGGPGPDNQGGPGDQGASFQTFYDELGSQGNWVNTDNYGYVWQPNVQDPEWAPYTNGHWVYTEDGWTWVADDSEPWGWATYHYGRWANIDDQGWVWIPGYTWAPAWVSWRYGGGYCGWAPLPPETSVGIDFAGGDVAIGLGFHIGGDCDRAYGIGAGYYNFVQVGFLGERNYRGHYQNRYNNYTIINNTRNVTNINVGREGAGGGNRFGRVSTGGPAFAAVNAESHVPIQRARLTESNQRGNASLRGDTLAVYAPRVNGNGNGNFRPRNVAGNLSHAQINRGSDISRPLVVNQRLRGNGPSPQEIQAARDAEIHAPADAKIATSHNQMPRPLTQPLTSFRPNHAPSANGQGTGQPNIQIQGVNHNFNGTQNQNALSGDTTRQDRSISGQGQAPESQSKQINTQPSVNTRGNASPVVSPNHTPGTEQINTHQEQTPATEHFSTHTENNDAPRERETHDTGVHQGASNSDQPQHFEQHSNGQPGFNGNTHPETHSSNPSGENHSSNGSGNHQAVQPQGGQHAPAPHASGGGNGGNHGGDGKNDKK